MHEGNREVSWWGDRNGLEGVWGGGLFMGRLPVALIQVTFH
jgi:hypothetical protein